MNEQTSGPAAAGEPSDLSRRDSRRMRRRTAAYDPINRVMTAGLLVMAGVILLANQLGILPSYHQATPWAWIALGAGVVFLLTELVRALSGENASANSWTLLLGLACLGIGASVIFGVTWQLIWPAALILVGVVLLLRNFGGR